ncbi:hypothetical protein CPB84DRAFT_1680451 [Gymnopilus junonius]|uniref:Ubinuclein middle domain-containing protein n=1 Tax=Gymnopilus junonius TaxID=109634 RepID=A0A9P5NKN6_GYMJU|nr:hypothetical protein CPB84DRAFT_1680451 [Gymnopilus junonius]
MDPGAHSPPPESLSVSAATSRRSSLATTAGKSISVQGDGTSSLIPVLVHSPSPTPSNTGSASHAVVADPSSASPATDLKPPPSSAPPPPSKPASSIKPRSSKPKARSPSPSPPPPPPPPPQTIRLQIKLGGPSNYEVDIRHEAKETGQRPPTPPPPPKKVADSSDSEDDEDDKKDDKPLKKKRTHASEYYDTSDPFIDDSELALDERQYFAQTKQQGFYVSSGEVALLKDKTPKKPKSKKISFATGLHPSLAVPTEKKPPATVEGTRDAPIAVDNDDRAHVKLEGASLAADTEHVGQKRKRQTTVMENGKRKKVVDESLFHPDLQVGIQELKDLIAKESWENKGKFPPNLKPPLAKLALLAIRLDEYDDDFFSLMPTLFPYNKFTMTKLIKRTVFGDHLSLLTERQEMLLAQLKVLAHDGFAKAEEEWEKSVLAWDRRQEKLRHEQAEASGGTGSVAPTRHPTEEMEVDGHPPIQGSAEGETSGAKEGKEGKPHVSEPPAKRYRLTEQMKSVVWELVLLSNESCRLENEKNSLEGSVIQISDQGLRKVLYQKIVNVFPEGWMNSGQISRDVSAMKKKLEKEAMEQDDD